MPIYSPDDDKGGDLGEVVNRHAQKERKKLRLRLIYNVERYAYSYFSFMYFNCP